MTKVHHVAPLEVGEGVVVVDDGNEFSGVVRSIVPWLFILVETTGGLLYLSIVMNLSAVSWSRLVLLEPWVKVDDAHLHTELVKQISYYPKRANVDDVNGALRLCDPESDVRRASV